MSAIYGAAHCRTFGCEFCVRSNCVSANSRYSAVSALKKLHAIPPSAITGGRRGLVRGTWPRPLQRRRGLLFAPCRQLETSQHFRTAASLPPASGSVVAARPLNGSWVKTSALPGLDTVPVEALFLCTIKRRRNCDAAKMPMRPVIFPGRAGRPPFRGTEVWGTKVKEPHHHHFTAGSTPNDRRPRKRYGWGTKAKPLAAYRRRLCCLSSVATKTPLEGDHAGHMLSQSDRGPSLDAPVE